MDIYINNGTYWPHCKFRNKGFILFIFLVFVLISSELVCDLLKNLLLEHQISAQIRWQSKLRAAIQEEMLSAAGNTIPQNKFIQTKQITLGRQNLTVHILFEPLLHADCTYVDKAFAYKAYFYRLSGQIVGNQGETIEMTWVTGEPSVSACLEPKGIRIIKPGMQSWHAVIP